MALLHLPQDVDVQEAFHFVPMLEWVPVRAFLPLQLSWFSCRGEQHHPYARGMQ